MMMETHGHDPFAAIARSPMVSTRHNRRLGLQSSLPSAIVPDRDRRCSIRRFLERTQHARRILDQDEAGEELGQWWDLLQSTPIEVIQEAVIIHSDLSPIVSDLLVRQFVEFDDNEHKCTKLVMDYASFIHDLDVIFRISCRLYFRRILTHLHEMRDRHRPPSIEHVVLDAHLDLGRSRAVLATISAFGNDPLLFTRYCWRIWSDSWPQLCQIAAVQMYPAIPPWIIRDCLGLLPDSSAKQTPDSIIIFLHYLHEILHRHPSSHQDVDVTEPIIEISLSALNQCGSNVITAKWASAICDEVIWQPNLFYFNPHSVFQRCQESKSYPSALLALYAYNRDMASTKTAIDLALSSNRMELLTRLAKVRSLSSQEWLSLLDRCPISTKDDSCISLSGIVSLLSDTVGSVPSIRLLLQSRRALQSLPTSHWYELFKLSIGSDNLNRVNCETLFLMAEHGGSPNPGDITSWKITLKTSECRLCWKDLRPDTENGVEVVVFGCGHGFHSECQTAYPTCPTCLYERILCKPKQIVPPCQWSAEESFLTSLQTATTL